MNNKSVLQQDVMRRVYFIHLMKKITQPVVSEIVFILALIFGETFFVSFGDVYVNAGTTDTLGGFFVFAVSAFLNTNFAVQAMTVGIAAASVFLSIHLYKQSVRLLSSAPFPFFRLSIFK